MLFQMQSLREPDAFARPRRLSERPHPSVGVGKEKNAADEGDRPFALRRRQPRPVNPPCCHRRANPSWACDLVQSPMRSIGITDCGFAIPLRRYHLARPGGLPNRPSRADGFNIRLRTSRRVSPPSRAFPGRAQPHPLGSGTFPALLFPLAHAAREVRFTRALPARHLPPSGFGYPLDGLLPRVPCPPCFRPAAPVGFSPRSLLLQTGRSGVTTAARPACRYTRDPHRRAEARPSRIPQPGCRVLPAKSPSQERGCLACVLPDAPLGFALPGVLGGDLGRDFAQPPPTRF